ncbi:MAG: [protein-PII] uridylyltransferase [Deltaproteobacteria bacterium]|nr:[protein-PII] uridylyltransferase [Deltaproteobacteria bacterium]
MAQPASEQLKDARETLLSHFEKGGDSGSFLRSSSEIMDQYFRRNLQESTAGHRLFAKKKAFSLVAVGGYGRKELSVHSDIDIMILFKSRIPSQAKELAKEMFFPLWDLGFDLGYGIRSCKDCLALAMDDFEVFTSFLDARFICGDSLLFLAFMRDFHDRCVKKKARAFGQWLKSMLEIRVETYGDASFLLEPHLKEGIGGLRDYHHILWLSKVFYGLKTPRDLEYQGKLSHSEYQLLMQHLNFLWLVRNHLHHVSGRKNDRLSFEYQERIARKLGYRKKDQFAAVEQFLSKLHVSMSAIKSLHRSFMRTHLRRRNSSRRNTGPAQIAPGLHLFLGELHFQSPEKVLERPQILMDIFERSAALGIPLSLEGRRLVEEFLYLVDKTFRASPDVGKAFLDILKRKNAFEALDQMYECGLLEKFLPEFSRIKDRVQFDAYHTYPVGMHSLQTVKKLKELGREKDILLPSIYAELSNPEPLLLAALFHDIGKTGKNHAKRGALITKKILGRFSYPEDMTEDVLFLVRQHLLLSETATRRDLNDEKAIVQCARTITTIDRLKMLYLLTWADSMATGKRAWNDWVANLVQELFFKIHHLLAEGELATQDAALKAEKTKRQVRRFLGDQVDKENLANLFDIMSPRYLLETRAKEIAGHILAFIGLKQRAKQLDMTSFFLDARESEIESYCEVTFLAKDRPGLFSEIAGVLSLNNINILSARVYTWRDGTAVGIIRVTQPLDSISPGRIWEKVRRDLKNTFAGTLSLAYRLREKAEKMLFSAGMRPNRPPQVIINNTTSDFFTLVEVFADDRVGLLYLITRTLFELRLDIRIAKVATKGDQIADVFYVRDLLGQKVEDQGHIEEIEQTLLYQLTHG